MFITIHGAAGVLIGKKINNVLLAFLLGILSHFLLDLPPHGDQDLGKKFFGFPIKSLRNQNHFKIMALYAALDALILSIFLIFMFKNYEFARTDSVVWAIIGGILPDILVITYKITEFKPLKWFFELHRKNHHLILNRFKRDIPMHYGIFLQLFFLAVLIWLIHTI